MAGEQVAAELNPLEDRRGDILAALKEHTPAETPAANVVAQPSTPEPVDVSQPLPDVQPVASGVDPKDQVIPAAVVEAKVEPAKPDLLEPPSNWSKADKERFAEQPEAARKFILDRAKAMEADYTRKTMEVADLRKEYGTVDEMFTPFNAQLRQAGYTPSTAIQAWMAAEQALMNPATREDAIKGIANAYGISLAKLAGVAATAPAEISPEQQQLNELINPYLTPLQQEIKDLKEKLAKTETFQTQSVTGQRQQIERGVMNEIQTFIGAKDAGGNLLHPYFADVESDMATIAAGYAQMRQQIPPLDELYQRAVRANPSTYERLTAQQSKAAETNRLAEARAKSAQAKRAGSSVTGAPGSGQPLANGQDRGIRGEIMAALEDSRV